MASVLRFLARFLWVAVLIVVFLTGIFYCSLERLVRLNSKKISEETTE